MNTTKQEAIKIIVAWWAQFIGKPSQEGLPGDRESFGSLFAMFARNSILNNASADRTLFEKCLTEFLMQSEQSYITLSTDYGPEYPLSGVCRASKCSGMSLPQKAIMWIDFEKGTVIVSPGYQKEPVQIYPVPTAS